MSLLVGGGAGVSRSWCRAGEVRRAFLRGTFPRPQRQGLLSGTWLCVLDSPGAPLSRGCPRLWEQAPLCPLGRGDGRGPAGPAGACGLPAPSFCRATPSPQAAVEPPQRWQGAHAWSPTWTSLCPACWPEGPPGGNPGGEVALGLDQRVNFPIRTSFQRFQLRL